MNFSESFKQALDSLKSNKLRSILTMLGIVMGVFSVITIVAIGNAAQGYIDAQFDKLGANYITINHKSRDIQKSDWLMLEDFDIIKKAAPEIKNIAADIQQTGEIRVGSKSRDLVVAGCSSQFASFNTRELAVGRNLTDIDVSTGAKVIIVDEIFAKRYFKKVDIVGQTVQIRNRSGDAMQVRVIGVTKSEGLFDSMMDNDYVPVITFMPITTVQSFFNVKKLDEIMVSVEAKGKLKEIGERIVKALEFKHGNTQKYGATSSTDMQKQFSNITNMLSAVLLVIAIITLIVGGIGIVNILLVSVTERIREIGVRKALGAQKKDIVFQFLTESIIMTGTSGLMGIVLGLVAGGIISALLKLPPIVNVMVVVLSFLGSVVLGLVFGVYPAKKAADLDPIESLRYE